MRTARRAEPNAPQSEHDRGPRTEDRGPRTEANAEEPFAEQEIRSVAARLPASDLHGWYRLGRELVAVVLDGNEDRVGTRGRGSTRSFRSLATSLRRRGHGVSASQLAKLAHAYVTLLLAQSALDLSAVSHLRIGHVVAVQSVPVTERTKLICRAERERLSVREVRRLAAATRAGRDHRVPAAGAVTPDGPDLAERIASSERWLRDVVSARVAGHVADPALAHDILGCSIRTRELLETVEQQVVRGLRRSASAAPATRRAVAGHRARSAPAHGQRAPDRRTAPDSVLQVGAGDLAAPSW